MVVDDVGCGGHTKASGRPPQKLAMSVLLRWGRNSPDLVAHDPFQQVELLHEPRTTTDPNLADPKQPVERDRTFGPVAPPRTVSRTGVDEFSRRKRTLPNLVEYLVEIPLVGGGELDKPLPGLPGSRSRLVPTHKRFVLDGHQRGLVTPGLEPFVVSIRNPVEQGGVIGAEPGEEGQVLRAHDDRHRVELQQADTTHHPPDMTPIDVAGGARVSKPLRRQRDASRLRCRERPGHAPRCRARASRSGNRQWS